MGQIKELQNPELTPGTHFDMQQDYSARGYMTARNNTRDEIEIVNTRVEARDTESKSKLQKKTFGLQKKSIQPSDVSALGKNVKIMAKNSKSKIKNKINKSMLDQTEKESIKKSSKQLIGGLARPTSVMKPIPGIQLEQNCILLKFNFYS